MEDTLRDLLRELEQFGRENDARARQRQEKMLNITPDTGEFLAILVHGAKARRVLEVGTSNGYSTLWLADAVSALNGQVVTVDVSATKAAMARQNLERAGLTRWVRQEVMDAGDILRRQPAASVDLLFLDSERTQYTAWCSAIQVVLTPGGLLVADNAVSHSREMEPFLALVRAAAGWRSVVVPVGNGEFLALKPLT
jgi:predicted O-methyltransferase YrrM